ncbi:hypothetical protein FNH13_11085 [Ornithinimicrobium ciconiae]|uniref:histidine kinase n=1 Tax=Ornithinimicrobium ciconiae TaxID=2594265 RepID=A0A516GBA9_9MICO|nr:hypothetical protein FNH13_11085 [Ornithinimicrobium ciconiae]
MTPAASGSTLAALAAIALSCLVSGLALVLTRRARVSGALLAAAGATGVVGAVLCGSGLTSPGWPLVVISAALLLPLALTTYPRPHWRDPVDLLGLILIAATGVVVVTVFTRPSSLASLGLLVVMILVGHTWWRLERASGPERRALQWMAVVVGGTSVIGFLVWFATEGSAVSQWAVIVLVVIGPALWVGVAAPEIVDVRGVAVSTVVWVITTLTYLAIFVGLASIVELTGGMTPGLGALALVGMLAATTVHPLRLLLRGAVDALITGTRPAPLDAAQELVGQIRDDPGQALHDIRAALALPWVALRVRGRDVATSGVPTPHTHTVVVDPQAELVVGLRAGDLSMPRDDRLVLDLVAPLLAQVLRAQALVAELHAARERSVVALAEERRRLRADLHDGLGPRLTGVAFTADAAVNMLRVDPDGAEALLRTLRGEVAAAIADIRDLSYALRPPALDELGLLGALRQLALGLRTARGGPLTVSVEGGGDLSALPAGVEVAAYRIVAEALTNIGRHSSSSRAAVTLHRDDVGLHLTVEDEAGTLPGVRWVPGVGLSSMSDRANELGGTLTAGPTRSGGRVSAFLPATGAALLAGQTLDHLHPGQVRDQSSREPQLGPAHPSTDDDPLGVDHA